MATTENLKEAFAGESQANRRYLAFAKKAGADGYPQIAKLFRAAAAAETVHAHNHLRVMGGIKSTVENLQAAIEGEGAEFQDMYPKFILQAEQEGNQAAAMSFKDAMAVEKIHHELYKEALNVIKEDKDLTEVPIFVCSVCGNTVTGKAPEKCPICGSPKEKFSGVD